jgi:hypothetical protein
MKMVGNLGNKPLGLNSPNSRKGFGNLAHPRIQLTELRLMIDSEITFHGCDQTDDLFFSNLYAPNPPNGLE